MRKLLKRSLLVSGIFTLFLAFSGPIHAAYIISSLDYTLTPSSTVGKIGSYVQFQMAVIDASATYNNVTQIVAVTITSIEVASADFPATDPSAFNPLFIYDGVHTWRIETPYVNAVRKSVQLSNNPVILISGSPVSNYTSLQFATFTGANGAMAGGAPLGSAKIDIGTAVTGINIYDDGDLANHNDATAADGIYSGRFEVREAYQFNISNGSIVGHFTNVTKASNDPFISPSRITLDSIRPRVELVNASPNPYNPNKELCQIFYYLTENSTVQLDVKFYNAFLNVTNTVKTFSASGYFGYNQPVFWDGLDESGVLQTDGDYIYQFSITDSAGNTGAVFTGILKLTTVEIITSLYSIDTTYAHSSVPQTVVTTKMQVELRNATFANLRNLGFEYPTPATYDPDNYLNYPWVYIDLRVYDIAGTVIKVYPKDLTAGDMDSYYIDPGNFFYGRQFQGGSNPPIGFVYEPFPESNPCSVTNTVIYTVPDNIPENDWDSIFYFPLDDQGGGTFTSSPTFVYYSAAISAGTYLVSFKGILVGKIISTLVPGMQSATIDCLSGTTTVQMPYYYTKHHAQPSFFYDESVGGIGDERGYGLSSQMRTISFQVEQPPTVPLPDSVPPKVVAYSEYPSDLMTLEPGIVGPLNTVKVILTDDGVGAGPVNLSTFVLKDPYGNQVPGRVAWNAGTPGTKTWEIYYIPDSSLTVGGVYTYTVVPVDASYNIGQSVSFTFNIADTSIPAVSNVNVQASTGASQQLSASASTPITFLVTKVQATLIPGGSAAVDWTNSNIIVRDASGNTVSGTMTHITGTSVMEFVPVSALADGSYTAIVTAVSMNNYQGASSYRFFISTANVTYINLNTLTPGENDTTCMRLSQFSASDTGIRDSASVEVDPADFSVNTVSAAGLPSNSTYVILSNPIRFSVAAPHLFPVTFNASLSSAAIRVHYTDADAAVLTALGLDEGDLTLWVLSGSTWSQIALSGSPVISTITTDRYIEINAAGITGSDNVYALMYVPPLIPPVAYNFNNTKVFNPSSSSARLFYTKDIASIGLLGGTGNVKVGIFAMNGGLVRLLEYQDTAEYASVFNTAANYEADPSNPGLRYYYFTWDGKNDSGNYVRNGIYVVKIEITSTGGAKSKLSRTIAVIK